ncbi:MAG: hypothetical protein ABI577_05980 [bacterium]
MGIDPSPNAVRPPVFLGCFLAAAAMVVLILFGLFAITFLESGANDGKVRLDVSEAYAEGSIEFVGAENFFIVRLRDGTFVALADLDQANRANQAQRCRVNLADISDPSLGVSALALSAAMTADARGASTILRETCNGAIYDISGARLNGDGANLDRYPISLADDGHLLVDKSARQCSTRSGATVSAYRTCS